MGGLMGVNIGSTSYSSASNMARTYGSEASARSEAAAALANDINYQTMERIMEFNHEEALLQREWEERMSNTAYQRAIVDMKSAGINPILAAMNGGASTPSGASASGSALNAAMANTYADQVSAGSSYSQSVDNLGQALMAIAQGISGIGSVSGLLERANSAADTVAGYLGSGKYKLDLKEMMQRVKAGFVATLGGDKSAKNYWESYDQMRREEDNEY